MENNIFTEHYLDLCGVACPVNFVKCCLALENLSLKDILKVDVDIGEPEISLLEGLKEKGYKVIIISKDSKMVSLLISSESN